MKGRTPGPKPPSPPPPPPSPPPPPPSPPSAGRQRTDRATVPASGDRRRCRRSPPPARMSAGQQRHWSNKSTRNHRLGARMPSVWHLARMSARQQQRGRVEGRGGRAAKAMRALVAPRTVRTPARARGDEKMFRPRAHVGGVEEQVAEDAGDLPRLTSYD